MKYYKVICLSLLIVGVLAADNNTNDECWSLKFDIPCWKTIKETVKIDNDGK